MRKSQSLLVARPARVILQRAWWAWPGLILALGACSTTTPVKAPVAAVPAPPPPPPGLARIIGADAAAVTALLGAASRDVREGPARLLQFVRPPCILDLYLYPAASGVAQVRTAAARRADGSRIEAGACLALLLAR